MGLANIGRIAPLTVSERAVERALAESVDIRRMIADVETMTETPRYMGSPEYLKAASFVIQEAEKAGWSARLEPADHPVQTMYNVVIERAGTAPDDERKLVIAGAHLDSVAEAPGANDNAAAVATVLEGMRALAGTPTRHDIKLVIFDGEESYLLGSTAWIAAHPGDVERAITMLNVEMPASAKQKRAAFSLGKTTKRSLAKELARVSERNGIRLKKWPERNSRSDHHVFDAAGVPSAMFGTYLGGTIAATKRLDPYYHTPEDTVDKLNHAVFLDHARAFTLGLHDIAQTPAPELAPARASQPARWGANVLALTGGMGAAAVAVRVADAPDRSG